MSRPQGCHVVLVTGDDFEKTRHDFRRIAAAAQSHGVHAHIVNRRTLSQLRVLRLWNKPVLSIAPAGLRRRKLLPGRFLSGRFIGKIGEFAILEAAGVPVPKWVEITPTTDLDPEEWGPYVVEKPSLGRKGAHVRIRKTSRIRHVPPSELPERHVGGPMIAQQFIYTGQWPSCYRVVTFFGEVLCCFRETTRDRGMPLKSRWAFGGGGISIVANTKKMEVTMVRDESVMALASRAHTAAFPDVPLLNFDIAQDIETGKHFVLECHPWHPWWFFSSPAALSLQKDQGLDFDGQFDAMERAGRIVATKARELATRHRTDGSFAAAISGIGRA